MNQSDRILRSIDVACRAGYSVHFRPSLTGGVTVEVGPAGVTGAISIVRDDAKDAAGQALTIVLADLAEAERERAELRERIDSDVESRLSPERDLRAHDSFARRAAE